jgi:uncharacterized protein (DUF1800 family)
LDLAPRSFAATTGARSRPAGIFSTRDAIFIRPAANLVERAGLVRASRSSFASLRRVSRMELAQRIHDAARTVVAEPQPFGVTAETLAELQTAINETDDAANAPRNAVVAKKVATTQLAEAYREIEDLPRNELNPLLFVHRRKYPDLWQG